MSSQSLLPFCFRVCPVAEAEKDGFNEVLKPAFAQNCIKCHGEKGKVKGKVDLLDPEKSGVTWKRMKNYWAN